MATLDLQEQEQIEALKSWWKDNGNWILGVVLTVVIVMAGWRGWQYYQLQNATQAATLFQQVAEQVASKDQKRVNDAASILMDKYASTIYASRAALLAARINEQGNDVPHATSLLQWVIDHSGEPTLKDLARLRLAALLLDEKKYSESLNQLDANHSDSFDGLFSDLKGDVLSAQGNIDGARSAYKIAFEKVGSQNSYRNLIQMKLDALGPAK